MEAGLTPVVRYPDVTFAANGTITIAAHIATRLGLKPGDTINVIPDGSEYFLVAHHSPRDNNDRPIAHYRSQVAYVKGNKGSMRCANKTLCTAINFITQAPASSLFCGTPREGYKSYDVAIPIITRNNQFGK